MEEDEKSDEAGVQGQHRKDGAQLLSTGGSQCNWEDPNHVAKTVPMCRGTMWRRGL